MSKKTITKNFAFVIFFSIVSFFASGCSPVLSSMGQNDNKNVANAVPIYEKPQVVGTISSNEIIESSGIVASKCQENVFWTHNDSDDGAFIFAINTKGKKLGTYKVKNAKNFDWEDIAAFKNEAGECFLYIGDIGNNSRSRGEFTIYRVREPEVTESDIKTNKKNPQKTEAAVSIKFEYPDSRHDAETLLVHPQTGDIYVLTKRITGASGVYKLSKNYSTNKTNRIEKIANITVPAVPNGFLTGGDISSDGRRVVVCDYFAAYEILLPENAKNFDEIWKQKPNTIPLGERAQGEAVGYSPDGKSIFATSERQNSPLIEVRRREKKQDK